jgi:hypothetical protein
MGGPPAQRWRAVLVVRRLLPLLLATRRGGIVVTRAQQPPPSSSTALSDTFCTDPANSPLLSSPAETILSAFDFQSGPIYCTLQPVPSNVTTVEVRRGNSTGHVSWIDEFQHNLFESTMDVDHYSLFYQGTRAAAVWRHNDHWMVDATRQVAGAQPAVVFVRPNQRFAFPADRTLPLVIEVDYSASMFDYRNDVWGEVIITTADRPSASRQDGQYGYDSFRQDHALGCRLEAASQYTICAWQQPGDTAVGERAWEIGALQLDAAATSFGGAPTAADGWTVCEEGVPDMNCRVRFRVEITETSVTIYVGDVLDSKKLYFQQTGLSPPLSEAFYAPEGVYIYFASAMAVSVPEMTIARWHWDRIAIRGSAPSAQGKAVVSSEASVAVGRAMLLSLTMMTILLVVMGNNLHA